MFAEFYRKKLSRRLLFDKSASDDHERSILTRLKQQCGAQFTSKVRVRRGNRVRRRGSTARWCVVPAREETLGGGLGCRKGPVGHGVWVAGVAGPSLRSKP